MPAGEPVRGPEGGARREGRGGPHAGVGGMEADSGCILKVDSSGFDGLDVLYFLSQSHVCMCACVHIYTYIHI